MVTVDSDTNEVKIPEFLANPEYPMSYTKQPILRWMGYGDHEYQGEAERRGIIERAYKAPFPTDHLSDANLITHIEDFGPPESKKRFERICAYLSNRGIGLIKSNVENRDNDGNHRSFRQVHQTFEDGIWFVETFGNDYDYVGFGRLISENPPGNYQCGTDNLSPEPLLVFEVEALPSYHAIFSQEEGPPKFCRGASESDQIQFKEDNAEYSILGRKYDSENHTMRVDENGDVSCSSCGMGYFSDTAIISEQKYGSHAHLIGRRFKIADFVSKGWGRVGEDEFNEEWTRQRGRLGPEAEAAIARAFLSDHIAPMRADADEMAGIPGDPIKRYRLDRVTIGSDATEPPIEEKSRWPHEVKRKLSGTLLRVDKGSWDDFSEEERIDLLKGKGAHRMNEIKDAVRGELSRILRFRGDWEFDKLFKHVRGEMNEKDSGFAVAGRGGGTRYAMFTECFECHTPEVKFGDGHKCKCSKCRVIFTGIRCERPECLLTAVEP